MGKAYLTRLDKRGKLVGLTWLDTQIGKKIC